VTQINKTGGISDTKITVVASIDLELLENHIDMKKIDADSVGDCTDESVREYLESMQERDASVRAEFIRDEVLAKVLFTMSEKDPALRVTKAVSGYFSLYRNMRLNFVWQAEEICRAYYVGNQAGHSQISNKEQNGDGQVRPQEDFPRVC
jgi:hypothetical protein